MHLKMKRRKNPYWPNLWFCSSLLLHTLKMLKLVYQPTTKIRHVQQGKHCWFQVLWHVHQGRQLCYIQATRQCPKDLFSPGMPANSDAESLIIFVTFDVCVSNIDACVSSYFVVLLTLRASVPPHEKVTLYFKIMSRDRHCSTWTGQHYFLLPAAAHN